MARPNNGFAEVSPEVFQQREIQKLVLATELRNQIEANRLKREEEKKKNESEQVAIETRHQRELEQIRQTELHDQFKSCQYEQDQKELRE